MNNYPPAPKPSGPTEQPPPNHPPSASLDRELTRSKEHLETSEKSLQKLHQKVDQTEAEITELQKKIKELRTQLAAKYQELEGYQDMIPHAMGEVKRSNDRLERLKEHLHKVEKDLRVEAWMEEMEREEEREQEGFKRYLQEVGRSDPDSIANVRVRSVSPPKKGIPEGVLPAFDRSRLREALSECMPSPPVPPSQLGTIINGGHEPDPNAPSLIPVPRGVRPPLHRRSRSRGSSPPHQFVPGPMRRTPSPPFGHGHGEPIMIHTTPEQFPPHPPPPPPPPPPFGVPVNLGSPVQIPVPFSPPPLIGEPHPPQFMPPFFPHGPSPIPIPVGVPLEMSQSFTAPRSFGSNRHESPVPSPLGSPNMRRHRVMTPVPVHHGSPPSPLMYSHPRLS